MNPSQFDSFTAIYHVNIICFPYLREAELVDAGVVTVDLEGEGESELEAWRPHYLCLGAW